MEGIKEAKRMNIGDVIEVDGNFFSIHKQECVNGCYNTKYDRYSLKVLLKKDKMDKLYKFLKDTGRLQSS